MKTTLLILTLTSTLLSSTAFAKTWTFTFGAKTKNSFKLNTTADSKEVAYKIAAKDCFQKLTNGVYPGESVGLEYIDICANPKM